MNRPAPGKEGGGKIEQGLFLRIALILGAGFWAFSPALHGSWLWDDDILITQNTYILDPGGLWKIWFQPGRLVDYYPLTYSAEWIEWRLWPNNPFGFRLTNIILHLGGSLLVWRVFHRLGLKWAWLGGLIFAIHPVNVESVAWISEIKNTLSLPPFLLAICAYLDFDERGKRRDYLLALVLFLAAMLCKTTMAMFPLVILLYAWWKRGRIAWADFKASAPFFAISLVLGLLTLGHSHMNADTVDIPLGSPLYRIVAAGLATSFYFSKCVLPIGLMPIYPRWTVDPSSAVQYLPYLLFFGVVFVSWNKRPTWGRHLLFGLGFFFIMLAPLVAAGNVGFTWAMDHLVYLPLIGLIGLGVAGLENFDELLTKSAHIFLVVIVTAVMAFLGWQSHIYTAVFRNEKSLWSYAIAQNAMAWNAYNNLGADYMLEGNLDDAISEYNLSLQIHPTPDACNNLGLALLQTDRLPEAIAAFESSRLLNPNYSTTYDHLGFALMEAGREADAKTQFETALQIEPTDEYARRFLNQIEATDKAVVPDQ